MQRSGASYDLDEGGLQGNKRRKKTTPRNFPSPVSLSPIRCLHALSSAKDVVWKGKN